jgi:hypothetical protein
VIRIAKTCYLVKRNGAYVPPPCMARLAARQSAAVLCPACERGPASLIAQLLAPQLARPRLPSALSYITLHASIGCVASRSQVTSRRARCSIHAIRSTSWYRTPRTPTFTHGSSRRYVMSRTVGSASNRAASSAVTRRPAALIECRRAFPDSRAERLQLARTTVALRLLPLQFNACRLSVVLTQCRISLR